MNDPLKLLPVDITKIRAQDVIVVAAVCIAIFLFRAPNVWELQPSWQLDTVTDMKYKAGKNRLPLPIITDLDRDGINELVIATEDSRLKLLMLPPQEDHDLSSTLPHLHLKTEVVLECNSSKPALPVALGTGCEHRSTSSLDVCHQIIVVVTDDGAVHCFTDQLELMWKAKIFTDHKPSDLRYFEEIAVHVVPDSGLVVIGGKMASEGQRQDHLEHNHQHNLSTGLTAEQIAKLPPRRHRNVKTQVPEEKEHFSTYAFDSKTGAAHWKHEPGDYETDSISREDLLSAYHFKLALHSSQYHVGEVHWSQYTDSLIASLPYRWQHPGDTMLQTAHFVKKRSAPLSKAPRKDFKTSDGPQLNRVKPNAVVIKREKSIEVLSLDSGQPLCSYPISKDVTSIGDVNGDSVIDHVTTYFSSEHVVQSEISPCSAVVSSGAKTLFSGSICRATSTFGFFDSIDEADFRYEPMPVSPLLVPSPPDRTGIFSHLSGQTFKRQSIRSFDSVFVVASGRLTSFGPYGEFNWQVDTGASWANYNPSEIKLGAVFVPNIQAVSTSVGGVKDAVLITGLKDISLVSLKDGSLLSSHSIPCEPLSPIVHGDFTNDGLMDFIVHCKTSYLGFSLDSRPGYLWTVVWIACGLSAIVVAVLILRCIEEVIA